MSSLRRTLPLFASLTVHGAILAAVLATGAMPAFGFDGDESGEHDALTFDEESLEAYLARAEDDVDFGEPTADLVGIAVLPDYVEAAPVAAAPAPAPAPAAEVAAVPQAAPVAVAEAVAVEPTEAEAPVAEVASVPPVADAEVEVAPSADEVAAAEAAVAELAPKARYTGRGGPLRRGQHYGGGRPRGFRDSDPDDGIKRTGRTSWEVERDLLDYYATHIPELMSLGGVRVHVGANKKPDGFRVKVKSDLLRATGLRSGDVVKSVNGVVVHDFIGALRAYFKLRTEKHIELILMRNGQELRYSYDLV